MVSIVGSIPSMGGAKLYYKNRIFKILIPTWVFISLGYLLVIRDDTPSLGLIIQWLTCTFNGTGGIPGIGASWYVFVVMWLYLLPPLIVKVLNSLEIRYHNREMKMYLTMMGAIVVIGMAYRLFSYLFLDWYNWTYANVLGCADLFLGGILAYRMTYFLPRLSKKSIQKFRVVAVVALVLLICFCLNFGCILPYAGMLYKYIWASGYLVATSAILAMYSYQTNEKPATNRYGTIANIFNTIAPYTFTFYLWHSFMLMYVASTLNVTDGNLRFLLTMLVGFVVSSYIAFLMKKMNNGIIKTFSKI